MNTKQTFFGKYEIRDFDSKKDNTIRIDGQTEIDFEASQEGLLIVGLAAL